jgi:rhodanese-related sulfurtransferase
MSISPFHSITVQELASQMQDEAVQRIDVREPEELAIASLPNFINLPLSRFSDWSEQIAVQLAPDAPTVVLCHHGIRSAQMCQWLTQQGFTNVSNVVGGIEEYAAVVDSQVPRY